MFRSVGFSSKTKYNYPLICIETLLFKDNSEIYIFDIGFNPPFYDLSGAFNDAEYMYYRKGKGLDGVTQSLQENSIFVTGLEKVDLPLY
ncbi:MAG: hypothetical protein P9L97_07435 [Candidatus Tenebribacter davisii]|nr:hypothetical protein [Candidatus Tenebribacter davisii]